MNMLSIPIASTALVLTAVGVQQWGPRLIHRIRKGGAR